MDGEKKDLTGLKPSIMRLRTLREKLCTQETVWEEAFQIRDFVLAELNTLHDMLVDTSVKRKDCAEKAKSILSAFEETSTNTSEK